VEVEVLVSEENILQESIQSQIDHEKGILMGRLTHDVDLMEGILEACKRHNITAGSVSCMGSLKKATLVQPKVEDEKFTFTKPIVWNQIVELLSGTGFIGYGVDGELDFHLHGTYVNHRGEISGGHFLLGENPTAITIEFIVHFSNKIVLLRQIDEKWKLPVFQLKNGGGK
jgi:predicted DNA-binding protein with PD1-like motif